MSMTDMPLVLGRCKSAGCQYKPVFLLLVTWILVLLCSEGKNYRAARQITGLHEHEPLRSWLLCPLYESSAVCCYRKANLLVTESVVLVTHRAGSGPGQFSSTFSSFAGVASRAYCHRSCSFAMLSAGHRCRVRSELARQTELRLGVPECLFNHQHNPGRSVQQLTTPAQHIL